MNEPGLLSIGLLSFLAGVLGTGSGGVLAYFFPHLGKRFFSLVLGFAAGVMLVIVFMELLAESLVLGGYWPTLSGLAAGIAAFLWLDSSLPHWHPVTGADGGAEDKHIRKGYLIAAGIALHNLPEGMAIGAGFAASSELGIGLAVIIGLHNIPEGLSIAVPLKAAGKKVQGLWASCLAGVPMGLGGLLGAALGQVSFAVLSFSLAFAAGAMLYIVCDELIPDAYEAASGHYPIVGILVGTLLGIMIVGF